MLYQLSYGTIGFCDAKVELFFGPRKFFAHFFDLGFNFRLRGAQIEVLKNILAIPAGSQGSEEAFLGSLFDGETVGERGGLEV